jgi:hypothetical protein
VLVARFGRTARPPAVGASSRASSFAAVVRHLASTVAGGYAVFAVLVVVFYSIGGRSLRFILGALGAGALLGFGVAGPILLFAVWVQRRKRSAGPTER